MTPGNWRHGIPETSGASLARLKKEQEPELRGCLFAIAATPFKRARIDVLAFHGVFRPSETIRPTIGRRSNRLLFLSADRVPWIYLRLRAGLASLALASLLSLLPSMGTDHSCRDTDPFYSGHRQAVFEFFRVTVKGSLQGSRVRRTVHARVNPAESPAIARGIALIGPINRYLHRRRRGPVAKCRQRLRRRPRPGFYRLRPSETLSAARTFRWSHKFPLGATPDSSDGVKRTPRFFVGSTGTACWIRRIPGRCRSSGSRSLSPFSSVLAAAFTVGRGRGD